MIPESEKRVPWHLDVERPGNGSLEVTFYDDLGQESFSLEPHMVTYLVGEIMKHSVDGLDKRSELPMELHLSPAFIAWVGVPSCWQSIQAEGSAVRLSSQKAGRAVIHCNNNELAATVAQELRNNSRRVIGLGDGIRKIFWESGGEVYAEGLSAEEIEQLNKSHERLAPCVWERGVSMHFDAEGSVILGPYESLLRVEVVDRTLEIESDGVIARATFVTPKAALAALEEVKNTPRVRLRRQGVVTKTYCMTRYYIHAEGISEEESSKLDAACHRASSNTWRYRRD